MALLSEKRERLVPFIALLVVQQRRPIHGCRSCPEGAPVTPSGLAKYGSRILRQQLCLDRADLLIGSYCHDPGRVVLNGGIHPASVADNNHHEDALLYGVVGANCDGVVVICHQLRQPTKGKGDYVHLIFYHSIHTFKVYELFHSRLAWSVWPQTLYTTICTEGAVLDTVPLASPRSLMEMPVIRFPAAMVAV
jgi:hypothetical protein